MVTSDIAGKAKQFDRWLGAQLDKLLLRKYRIEAVYCEKRAERAREDGDLSAAVDYYERAVTLRGRLADREASAELGMKLAEVARETGDLELAHSQYKRVAELHSRRENATGALAAIEPIIEIANERDDDDALSEWWGNALMVLGNAKPGEIGDARRNRLILDYADQIHTEDSAARIYGFGLEKLFAGDEEAGDRLVDAAWERRDVVREAVGGFRLVLAAGVARVARAELTDRDIDREEALEYVADYREKLSPAATALFEELYEGETDTDPEDLKTGVSLDDPPELRDLEAEVFGRFLEDL